MTELAGVMVGNYFLLECLSRVGCVETYRARPTTRGGYDVILRLFRPRLPGEASLRVHFAEEVEKVWRCDHPHIMPLVEFGSGEDLLYSVTLLPEAETLEQFLDRQQERFLPLPFVVKLMEQLASAVEYAHQQGIVHGNIQPDSLFLNEEGDLLLTNFGMCRAYQQDEPVVPFDGGNPSYIAPEQRLGMLSPASDVYALAVLLYRLLGATLPFGGLNVEEIAFKHAHATPPAMLDLRPDLPDAVDLVLRVALSKVPGARFPTAEALVQALQIALEQPVSQAPPAIAERRIAVRTRRTACSWERAVALLADLSTT